MKTRAMFSRSATRAAVLFGLLSALVAALPAWAQPANLRMGYNKFWPTFPLHVGIAEKDFEKRGLKVEWINFNTPNHILQAMVAGEADMGVLTGTNLATAYQQNIQVKAIAMMTGPTDPPVTYFVRKDLGIKSVRDLKGKTIGVNGYGGNFDLFLRRHLVDNGLDPKTDVRIVEILTTQIIPALVSKQIDAGVVDGIFAATALKHYANDMVPLFTYRDVAPFKHGWNGFVLAVNDSYLAKSRKIVVQFVRACLDAVQSIHQNPQQGIKLYVEATGNKNALNLEKADDVPLDAKILIPELQSEMDLMVQFGYSKSKVNASEIVDHSLLEEAVRIN
jgi:ABC-type nitrate/sulfonate/bicarbonate transport system substrate-binding protein